MPSSIDLNNPKTQKAMLAIMLGVIVLIVAYYYLIIPQSEEIERLQRAVNDERAVVQRLVAMSREVPKLEQSLKESEEKIEYSRKFLPTQQEIPELLKNITYASQSVDASVGLFKPGRLESRGDYQEFKIELRLESTYHSLGNFLSNISRFPRIINVGDITITQLQRQQQQQNRHTVSVSMNLIAYITPAGK